MAINTSNSDKGRNGGRMPVQGSSDGASPMSRRSPGLEWRGGKKAASGFGGNKTEGFPSKTPRAGR